MSFTHAQQLRFLAEDKNKNDPNGTDRSAQIILDHAAKKAEDGHFELRIDYNNPLYKLFPMDENKKKKLIDRLEDNVYGFKVTDLSISYSDPVDAYLISW